MADVVKGMHALTIGSFNCQGNGPDKVDYIRKLMSICDLLFIQEHWLFSDNVVNFASQIGNVNIHGTSGMDESQLIRGRPYGGCAFLWRKASDFKFIPVECSNKRIVAGLLVIGNMRVFLCNVYMPCDGYYLDPLGQSYEDVLMDVVALLEANAYDHAVVGGDLNTDFSRLQSHHVSQFTEFCGEQDLFLCREHVNSTVDFTYASPFGNVKSEIDHFAISLRLRESVVEYRCAHDGDNLSYHSPLILKLNFQVGVFQSRYQGHVTKPNWKKASPENIAAYTTLLSDALGSISLPLNALRCADAHCVDHHAEIDDYFNSIVECCEIAADAAIPPTKKRKLVAGWSEFVAPFKDRSILWNQIWIENGRPPSGLVFDLMKKAKGDYKREAKRILRSQNKEASTRMAQALGTNEKRDLWDEVRRMKTSQLPTPDRVDEAQGEDEVCGLFSCKYEELYNSVPFDPAAMDSEMQLIDRMIESSCNRNLCYSAHLFTVPDVLVAISKLKRGKADSRPLFMSDQVIHGGPNLAVHLSLLFQCMLRHLSVPGQLKVATLVPITKNRKKSSLDSTNYRSIALSSIIGKVLDRMILAQHGEALSTSCLQFGFKKRHSTTQCTFVLQQVAQHYNRKASPCFVVLLDASKAFDKVEYVRLFSLLRQRGLCARVCKLLALMYTQQSMRVRWKSCTSLPFRCQNGVKQGGVLSPTLFCVFYDELLCRLERCGAGCFVGNKFVGALSYADDVTILAPCVSAVRVMLRVCESFANDYCATFNAEKSQFLVFGTNAPCATFTLNGASIKQVDRARHLGTFIGHGSTSANVREACANLYSRTNVIMSRFGHCSSDVLNYLFTTHCTSLYGCPLWDLNALDPLAIAWKKCLKRIWKIDIRTRSKYVAHLSQIRYDSVVHLRFFNFFVNCWHSKNDIIRLIARHAILFFNPVCANLLICSERSRIPIDCLVYETSYVRTALQFAEEVNEDKAAAVALKDLCLFRDGVLSPGFTISQEEFQCAFSCFL